MNRSVAASRTYANPRWWLALPLVLLVSFLGLMGMLLGHVGALLTFASQVSVKTLQKGALQPIMRWVNPPHHSESHWG